MCAGFDVPHVLRTCGPRADDAAFEVKRPVRRTPADSSRVTPDLGYARQECGRATLSLALITFAAAWLLLAGPLLDWRNAARTPRSYSRPPVFIAAGGDPRAVCSWRVASPADWSDAAVSRCHIPSPSFRLLLTIPRSTSSLTAATAGILVSLALFAVEAWRVSGWRRRRTLDSAGRRAAYAALQLGAGVVIAVLLSQATNGS